MTAVLVSRAIRRCAIAAFVVACLTASSRAQPPVIPEYNAKAGFLVAFPSYVTWPPDASASATSPVVLCVLGADPFGDVLDQTAAARIAARPLQVRRIQAPAESAGCQIVFIGRGETAQEADWLAALKARPVLTVGESGKTVERGGAVEFGAVRDRVAFEVSLRAAEQAGLKVSSDLLAHARKVYR
jgi:hypothetical protein